MTDQEAFTTAARHLLNQGKKSVDLFDSCRCLYRDECGRKCAIGCLIPDDLYHVTMENLNVVELSSEFGSIKQLFEGLSINLLEDLQSIHDRKSISDWEKLLKMTAVHFNLKWELESE